MSDEEERGKKRRVCHEGVVCLPAQELCLDSQTPKSPRKVAFNQRFIKAHRVLSHFLLKKKSWQTNPRNFTRSRFVSSHWSCAQLEKVSCKRSDFHKVLRKCCSSTTEIKITTSCCRIVCKKPNHWRAHFSTLTGAKESIQSIFIFSPWYHTQCRAQSPGGVTLQLLFWCLSDLQDLGDVLAHLHAALWV